MTYYVVILLFIHLIFIFIQQKNLAPIKVEWIRFTNNRWQNFSQVKRSCKLLPTTFSELFKFTPSVPLRGDGFFRILVPVNELKKAGKSIRVYHEFESNTAYIIASLPVCTRRHQSKIEFTCRMHFKIYRFQNRKGRNILLFCGNTSFVYSWFDQRDFN